MDKWQLVISLVTLSVVLSHAKVCPPGYSLVSYGSSGSCFKMQTPTTKNTYLQAVDACNAEEATLISASTMQKFTAVKTWLKEEVRPSLDIWVDVTYTGGSSGPFTEYQWSDGQPVQAQMWAKNEPSPGTTTPGDPLRVVFWRSRGKGMKLDNRSGFKLASYVCEKALELNCEQFGCWSRGGALNTCQQKTTKGSIENYSLELTRQHTSAACTAGVSYGVSDDKTSVWVNKGCKATFQICSDTACSKSNEVHCSDLSKCISRDLVCDGNDDCQDSSDESDCTVKKNIDDDDSKWELFRRFLLNALNKRSEDKLQGIEKKTAVGECITSCQGWSDGDHQSCLGCNIYATCAHGALFTRTCSAGTVWDDAIKNCNYASEYCDNLSRDPCTPNPCQNDGSCSGGVCTCPAGYLGDKCQNPDPCYPNPCQNGGSCNAGTCTCTAGFMGNRCETVDDDWCNEDAGEDCDNGESDESDESDEDDGDTGCDEADPLGESYTGTVSVTNTGKTCQAWAEQSPHVYYIIGHAAYWSDLGETAAQASNYCRNPDKGDVPWCLTTDPNVRWEYCTVPGCRNRNEPILPKQECPDGYESLSVGEAGSCYRLQNPISTNNKVSYNEAVDACAGDGASLLSASTLEEFDAVRNWLKNENIPKIDVWVGLTFGSGSSWGEGASYLWTDGEPALDSMWVKNEPSDAMTRYGAPVNAAMWGERWYKLDNRSPDRLASYICEKPKSTD